MRMQTGRRAPTQDQHTLAIQEAVHITACIGVGGALAGHVTLRPAEGGEVQAQDAPHVGVLGAGEHPELVAVHHSVVPS